MPDPRKPRQPKLPAPYKSDWSPRPIPQPAPERRTADPVTPTLKQLAAREAQRASMVVPPAADPLRDEAPKPRPAAPSGLCSATGLATPERVAAYKRDMQQLLQKQWAGLDNPGRLERVRTIVNAQLGAAGVPTVKVASAPLGTNALFFYDDWRLGIGDGLLGPEHQPPPAGLADKLTRTVYHEARHAEQYFFDGAEPRGAR